MAKKKSPGLKLFQQFKLLSPEEQVAFVYACLQDEWENPVRVACRNTSYNVHKQLGFIHIKQVMEVREKIPRKKGNPTRDELILQKAATMSDGAIAKDKEVIAAHTGKKKLTAETIQGVRRRHGYIKK